MSAMIRGEFKKGGWEWAGVFCRMQNTIVLRGLENNAKLLSCLICKLRTMPFCILQNTHARWGLNTCQLYSYYSFCRDSLNKIQNFTEKVGAAVPSTTPKSTYDD